MQGKGWEMVTSTRTQEENIDIFKTVKRLFDLENPTHAPIFTEFKTTVKIWNPNLFLLYFVIFMTNESIHDWTDISS